LLTTPRLRGFTQSWSPSHADDGTADNYVRFLEAQLPRLEHVPIVHGGVVMGIRRLREMRAADMRRRVRARVQYRSAFALRPLRTPRRPQARARRVRCAAVVRHQADSGGSDEGDGPPADGPLGPLRGCGGHGAVPSSPARLPVRFAPSAASPRQIDGPERRTLQRRHRRQGGAELRGTAQRLDTRSPYQPIDAPVAPQSESGVLGVGGVAPAISAGGRLTAPAPHHSCHDAAPKHWTLFRISSPAADERGLV
jgi:hypothetical protein